MQFFTTYFRRKKKSFNGIAPVRGQQVASLPSNKKIYFNPLLGCRTAWESTIGCLTFVSCYSHLS
jgi:hypothetical protein